jgi:hypothetical protein
MENGPRIFRIRREKHEKSIGFKPGDSICDLCDVAQTISIDTVCSRVIQSFEVVDI